MTWGWWQFPFFLLGAAVVSLAVYCVAAALIHIATTVDRIETMMRHSLKREFDKETRQ